MHAAFQPCVYLLASQRNGTLYAGVTSNLLARIQQHRVGLVRGFTRNYGVKLLVWFEQHPTMHSAITREKRIKKWNRAWKLELIEAGKTSRKVSASLRSTNRHSRESGDPVKKRSASGSWQTAAAVSSVRWVPAFAGMTRRGSPRFR